MSVTLNTQTLNVKDPNTGEYVNVATYGVPGEVADWLDDHPEATTTVQDKSITPAKFADSTVTYIEQVTDRHTASEIASAVATETASQVAQMQVKEGQTVVDATLTVAGAAADAKKTGDEIAELKNDLSGTAESVYLNASRSLGYKNLLNLVHIIHGAYYWGNTERTVEGYHYGKFSVKAGDVLTLLRCRFAWLRDENGTGSSVYDGNGGVSTVTIAENGTLYISFNSTNPIVCYGNSVVDESYLAEIDNVQVEIDNVQVEIDNVQVEIDNVSTNLERITGVPNFEAGRQINKTTGAIEYNNDMCVSEKIPVTWSGIASFDCKDNSKSAYIIMFYNADDTPLQKGFINPSNVGGATYRNINLDTQVSGTPAYVRFSFKKGEYGKVYKSSTEVIWEAKYDGGSIGDLENLATTDKTNLVSAINEIANKGTGDLLPISPEKTTFFEFGRNLIDPSKCVDGEYINQTNGNAVVNAIHSRTDYIPVEAETTYVIRYKTGSYDFRYAFYSAQKTFLSGEYMSKQNNMLITSPADAAYIRLSLGNNNTALFMLAKYENEDTNFYEYVGPQIPNKYLNINQDEEIIINLPSKIYALVGYELNIYFENITDDWTIYDWDITCSKGMQLERGYRVTPVESDVGTYAITISAKSGTHTKNVEASLVIVSASAGQNVSKSVIVLGDSTTNNGIAITKLNENFSEDVMNISTLGTRGTSPNNHEGRSGWSLSTYFTYEYIDYTDGRGHVENPFYNPTTQTFDAAYYFANSGIAKPDWFIVNMGINDMFNARTDAAASDMAEQCIEYLNAIIDSIQAASPNSKIGICLTIPPNHSQDAFGKAYSCGQTRNRCKRNNAMWVSALIEEYDDREAEGIYVIALNPSLDTVYNMGMETLPVNARNTEVTYESPIANGGVHPVTSGYWQIADVYTAFLKAHAED